MYLVPFQDPNRPGARQIDHPRPVRIITTYHPRRFRFAVEVAGDMVVARMC